MDLDAMDPAELAQDADLLNAATKIQASFRGHMARKQADKTKNDADLNKQIDDKIETKSPASNPDDELVDLDMSDPGLNHAAIKIQAQFRGHMTRKTIVKE